MPDHRPIEFFQMAVLGHPIHLPKLPQFQKFYAKLSSGTWEPRTFKLLAENLDKSTTLIDIGAWIGVTPYWASAIAGKVLAVEPDPYCRKILEESLSFYPNVTLLGGALSPDRTVVVNAVSEFGSSETSALPIGNGESIVVPGYSVDDIMRQAGIGACFVKLDVEGYEYEILEELSRFGNYDVKGIQCAIHPQLYERLLHGPWILRRLRTLWRTYRLSRLFPRLCRHAAVPRFGSLARYLLQGILLRRVPKGTDFVFLNRLTKPRKSN